MNSQILPPSSSDFMRCTTQATERLTDIPVDLRKLWNTKDCPVDLLPYLAWALSVDRWDKNWPEQTKRQVTEMAWLVHRQKGTITALRRVVEPFGYLLRVIEWWQSGEEPGTFRLEIGVQEQGITEETWSELERLIDDAKPCSRHLKGLSLSLQSSGVVNAGAGCCLGDTLTVYPYFPEATAVGGHSYTGAAVHLIDTVEIASGD
ncbi:phage tail protein I [Erwinia tracheiphila]|uniref:Tail protein n=1 Tax=Erwinia tracheiphila TaxID=65700 RepID=A0A0M2KLQ3_9GAMM|nr:phage tail protein I [Erwinia tracheiphila]AXF77451.1 phage tail protein I [Erwinia tracheiphila]EOS92598.1 phage tail protein I [Erwinia tracheiphila PSU-1]KKF34440.1 tail protein [Erwinia tracheiphila]KKF35834.1 tail protein [Erwinia tracheiphila]KKF38178.1 tail protein [Erwinia tracheiphila]